MLRYLIGVMVVLLCGQALANPVLNSATLPDARVVALGETATIFMTTINSGDMDANNCQVVPSVEVATSLDFSTLDIGWALTDAGGGLVGNVNDPFAIPAGGQVNLVLGIGQSASISTPGGRFLIIFHVECDGGFGSPGTPAVNNAFIQFSDTNPDIIPIIQTFTADGIANFDEGNRLAVISVAAVNNSAAVGVEADVGVHGRYLGFRDGGQFNFFACETDLTGQCIDPLVTCAPNPGFAEPCFTTKLGRDPKTYAFFVILPPGEGVNFFPGVYRFAPSFYNEFGSLIASSSVALNSADPVIVDPLPRPNGQFEVIARNTADLNAHTLRQARITITDRALTGRLFRVIDRGFFIQVVRAYFRGEPVFTAPPATPEKSNQVSRPMSGDTKESEFDVVYYNDGIATPEGGPPNPDGGIVPKAFITTNFTPEGLLSKVTGGELKWSNKPGKQFPDDELVLDFEDATDMKMIKFPDDYLIKTLLADDASQWHVSSTPDRGGGSYGIDVDPGPDGSIIVATYTDISGCVFEFTELDVKMADDAFDKAIEASIAALGMTPLSCPTGSRFEPFIGQTSFGNVESFPRFNNPDAREIEFTAVYGDVTDPNGAVLYNAFFLVDPGTPPDQPQVQSSQAKPTSISRYQEIADTHGKPVYLHVDGKDVLVATP